MGLVVGLYGVVSVLFSTAGTCVVAPVVVEVVTVAKGKYVDLFTLTVVGNVMVGCVVASTVLLPAVVDCPVPFSSFSCP